MDLIDDYYAMCEILDDDTELIVRAIKELAKAKEKPSMIIVWCENLNVNKLSKYVNIILSMPISNIKVWKISKLNRQTTMFDFMD